MNDDISSLKTKVAVLETYQEDCKNRLTRHKKDGSNRMDRIEEAVEKMASILWEGGLVSSVKANSDWIKEQCSQKNKTINFIYRAIILIIISFIAATVGLK